MLPLGDEIKRVKYYFKGVKHYAVIVRFNRQPRVLRQSARTADVAMRYGQAVMLRYRRWCDIAIIVESNKANLEHQS